MSVINKITYNKIFLKLLQQRVCTSVYEIECRRPSKQVWNLSACEVSHDQQFGMPLFIFP